ncbi:MAG: hypothetical protein ACYDAR_06515 [Thermomicrobiales bacterium]
MIGEHLHEERCATPTEARHHHRTVGRVAFRVERGMSAVDLSKWDTITIFQQSVHLHREQWRQAEHAQINEKASGCGMGCGGKDHRDIGARNVNRRDATRHPCHATFNGTCRRCLTDCPACDTEMIDIKAIRHSGCINPASQRIIRSCAEQGKIEDFDRAIHDTRTSFIAATQERSGSTRINIMPYTLSDRSCASIAPCPRLLGDALDA